jgi:acetyltransferase-like isoleucine patch superfamily enzyme
MPSVDRPNTLSPERLMQTPGGVEGTSRSRWLARGLLVLLGLPKTVYFNLRCLPFRQAVRLPILVSHRVALCDLSGGVTISSPVRPGVVLLGFGMVGAFDYRRSRSVWQVAGEIVFEGSARLGNGFKLSVAESGTVTFGPEFVLSAESQIVCRESIVFGRGCLISWDVLVLDSDFHPVVYDGGPPPSPEAPVVLGEHVWVGARASILKGVRLANDVVVAAGAIVTQSQEEPNVVVGGNPAQVMRTGVQWSHD